MRTITGGKGGIIHPPEKGDCINPNGRPVGSFSISKKLKELVMKEGGWLKFENAELLDENEKPTGQKVTVRVKLPNGEALTIVTLKAAMKAAGDARFIKALEMVYDRTDGKAIQPVDFNMPDVAAAIRSKFPFDVPDEDDL